MTITGGELHGDLEGERTGADQPHAVPGVISDLVVARRQHADAPALADGTSALTYADYADDALRLAALLVAAGVAPGDRVGVHLAKSVYSFVAVHGVIAAGAVMVPLDTLAPADHVASVLVDAEVTVLISDARARVLDEIAGASAVATIVSRSDRVAAPDGCALLRWDEHADMLADAVPRQPDDAAYIIYTSGSTGRPKGIVHTHRSALAYARLAADTYGLVTGDRLANVASLHFDQSTFELYAAPLVGASVTVVPDAVLRFPASVAELVESHAVTVWYSVPYVLRQLTARGALDQRDLSALRWVLYGGESYPPAELAALMRFAPNATVSNVYGPAEVNQCSYFHLAEPPTADAPIPIGEAWADTELAIVEPTGDVPPTPVVDGPGELLVASTTMMAGYWNRADLTAAAIVDTSIAGHRAMRWYRTGDLVERRADGQIVFLGRADHQVKIRGQRIELEAIDLTIRTLDTIDEVATVVETTPDGERRLVAVVELSAGGTRDAVDGLVSAVQRVVSDRHPRAAVPGDVVVVQRLTRTGTGKIDRNAAAGALVAHRAE